MSHEEQIVDYIKTTNEMFVGKTMVRAEVSDNGEYTRWYFDDGSYWEWYTHLHRGTSEQLPVGFTEGRMFKEEHD